MPNVYPDDILARLRKLDSFLGFSVVSNEGPPGPPGPPGPGSPFFWQYDGSLLAPAAATTTPLEAFKVSVASPSGAGSYIQNIATDPTTGNLVYNYVAVDNAGRSSFIFSADESVGGGGYTLLRVQTAGTAELTATSSLTASTPQFRVNGAIQNGWNDARLITVRTALSNYVEAPVKIAIIADSHGELQAFDSFIRNLMARYPSSSPSPVHIQGGFTAGNVLYPFTGTGTNSTGRGVAGYLYTMTTGQTMTVTPAVAGDEAFGDRVRIHYLPNVGSFTVTIDGVTAVGADGVDTGTTPVDTTANARDVTINTLTQTGADKFIITSFGLYTEDLVGSIVTHPDLPAGTRVVSLLTTAQLQVDQAATASSAAVATYSRPSWTSDKLEKGPHTVELTGASGTVKIDGIYYYNGNYGSQGGVQVHLITQSGWRTDDFYALSGGPATSAVGSPVGHVSVSNNDLQNYLADEGFHLVIHETVSNDQSVANYEANMPLLLAATRATLPLASLVTFCPNGLKQRAWVLDLPPVVKRVADAAGAVVANMAVVAYDYSAQTGTSPDEPYQLTVDGIHFSARGRKLVSDLFLNLLDPSDRADDIWTSFQPDVGGLLAPVAENNGTSRGLAWFESINQTNPDLFMGHWGLAAGFMAGDPAGTGFAPDTYLIRQGGGGGWDLVGGDLVSAGAVHVDTVTAATAVGIASTFYGFTDTSAQFTDTVLLGSTTADVFTATTSIGIDSTFFGFTATSAQFTATSLVGTTTLTGLTVQNITATNTASSTDHSATSVQTFATTASMVHKYMAFTGTDTWTVAPGTTMFNGWANSGTFTNGPSANVDLKNINTFAALYTKQIDTQTGRALGTDTDFQSSPVYGVANSGTFTSGTHTGHGSALVMNATGSTMTLHTAYLASNPTVVAGTITTAIGVDIGRFTSAGTTNIGLRCAGSIVKTPVSVTVTSNAGTVPVTCPNAIFTNSSATNMTVTMAVTGAVDGQVTEVRIFDASAVTKTITWVNTENGYNGIADIVVPANSKGSTTIPTYARFMYNGATSKWTCISV